MTGKKMRWNSIDFTQNQGLRSAALTRQFTEQGGLEVSRRKRDPQALAASQNTTLQSTESIERSDKRDKMPSPRYSAVTPEWRKKAYVSPPYLQPSSAGALISESETREMTYEPKSIISLPLSSGDETRDHDAPGQLKTTQLLRNADETSLSPALSFHDQGNLGLSASTGRRLPSLPGLYSRSPRSEISDSGPHCEIRKSRAGGSVRTGRDSFHTDPDVISFEPLIDALRMLQERGEEEPLRSLLGNILSKDRLPEGITDLRHYTELAHQAGIIELRGREGTSRISLTPHANLHP
ncbi:hypothetical protein H0H92_011904 [Tricholoma furcatifolium]|nr:hypothetical protein H0H92_011904 [Tricholoma furcatifolium]